MILTPVTKLDAVNEIIGSIGESPVNDLENIESVDVMNALRILDSVTREVLMRGWTFNTVEQLEILCDEPTGKIKWNDRWLYVESQGGQFVRNSDGYMLDVLNNTTDFSRNITAKVYLFVPFENIPQVFRHYITTRASRLFAVRFMGDPQLTQALQMEEQQAYMAFMEYELSLEHNTILQDMTVMDYMRRT